MIRIGILGEEDAMQIKELLYEIDFGNRILELDCLGSQIKKAETEYHIFIIHDNYPYTEKYLQQLNENNILLINSDNKDIHIRLNHKNSKIITYGLNHKACITASSLLDERKIQCCIQRSLPTIYQNTVTPQEFSVGLLKSGKDIHYILAAVSAGIILL